MTDLLLELVSEEIPARMQAPAREALVSAVTGVLAEAGLTWTTEGVRSFSTPRRLAVVVPGIPDRQEDRVVERRGPREDAPAAARDGFLRGLEGSRFTVETRIETKGAILVARIEEPGRPTSDLLAAALPEALQRFPWPKSMRWGSHDVRWVRPLQAIVCLFGEEVVPFRFGPVTSGRATVGHRLHGPEPIPVPNPAAYPGVLEPAWVIASVEARRACVVEGAEALAREAGLDLMSDPGLVDEITGLVEWPVPLLGTIDPEFMDVPPEVLVTTMRQHQKYLALRTPEGTLAPRFIVVANLEAEDGGTAIRGGNERVLRARLWDARFFWDQDRRVPLESRLEALDRMVFHARLGSLRDRAVRLENLSRILAASVPGAEATRCARAGRLAKADLVSGLVGEFPELQGVVGSYLARAHNEPEEVAHAIGEHYAPRGPDEACPTRPTSVVVALAERLDLLAGFFAREQRPTGSKDPFALRRAALGVIRLVLDNGLRLPLREAFRAAWSEYGPLLDGVDREQVIHDLVGFIADRLKVHLRTLGARHDLIAAVYGDGVDDDLVRLLQRIQALGAFLDGEEGRNLLAGVRRAGNIVAIEEKKDATSWEGAVDPARLLDPAEQTLHAALAAADPALQQAMAREDFGGAMTILAGLRAPVDHFFDTVLVNDPDPALRGNRLRLLSGIRSAFRRIADIDAIEEGA